MKSVLVIDNYDSFTFNLVHHLEELGCTVAVRRNDKFTFKEIADFKYLLLSPGPGVPDEAGLLKDVIVKAEQNTHILGVCLGMQAIGEVFGGQLVNLDKVYHGIASLVKTVGDDPLFKDIPQEFEAGRYHSWVVDPNLPDVLKPLAVDNLGQLMALKHKTMPIYGVQFHPESILTPCGKQLLKNWLSTPDHPDSD